MCRVLFTFVIKGWVSSLGEKLKKLEQNNDLNSYVLQLEDEIELAEITLEGLSKSVNQLVQKCAKSQPNNLMKLLQKSTRDCWRLPVVTLTTIAVSLPRIKRAEVDSLLESVREGLLYITVVEKCLNATDERVSSQKAAETLWREVIFDKKWLGNALQDLASQVNTADQHIVEWFRDKANKDNIEGPNDDPISRSICANSMYRLTETILLTCHTNIDVTDSQDLTNLPEVITMKCHTRMIEEGRTVSKMPPNFLPEQLYVSSESSRTCTSILSRGQSWMHTAEIDC
ncbi:hypothetical protein L1987_19949 [Smallanthus sonchifolius]|uniref:Uncharacterized protein n=1 Tax=Smallanthus sonchifolius TaxID=185202 RepID=A0ACB9IQF9_9ASTR|nr:hypothetical protein L1987_19949 [Smallanthus sonchifolius]